MPKEIKTAGDFILEAALYAPVPTDLGPNSTDPLLDLYFKPLKFDGHCPQCRQKTTFSRGDWIYRRFDENRGGTTPPQLPKEGFCTTLVKCARNDQHYIKVWFYATDKSITKVGQYPSLADIANDEARVYDKQLSEIDRAELHKAIGLFAHDVGVGSFVYLRRVFERLLQRSFESHKEEQGWDEKNWVGIRVEDRIKVMKPVLPDFLQDCPPLYSVLSKGIHELTEEECQACFPVVKTAILEILDDELRAKVKAQQRKATKDALSQMTESLSKPQD